MSNNQEIRIAIESIDEIIKIMWKKYSIIFGYNAQKLLEEIYALEEAKSDLCYILKEIERD